MQHKPDHSNSTVKQKHFLITDDDADDRELFSEAVAECNPHIVVTGSANAEELLNHLNNGCSTPDLIFLDLNMPGLGGKECLKILRSRNDLMETPVIIYSTSLSEKDIDETFRLGANLYISKPNSFRALVNTIQKLLNCDRKWLLEHVRERYIYSINL